MPQILTVMRTCLLFAVTVVGALKAETPEQFLDGAGISTSSTTIFTTTVWEYVTMTICQSQTVISTPSAGNDEVAV
jgi:hypothetical protein